MTQTMRTAVMTDLETVELTRRPIPQPGLGEVLVKIQCVGICGSDLHYYESGRIGDFVVHPPFVLGHEAAGTVCALGQGVTHLKIGDRVALEPGRTCGKCEFCRTGRYNLCPDVTFFATPPVDGVFCQYVAHDAQLCFALPDCVSFMEGALVEPLAVGFHAAMQGGAHVGQTAVITGAGCIGLVTLLALKAMGVTRVAVVDVLENRLEKAAELGAFTVNGAQQDAAAQLMQWTDGRGFDLAIETAGSEITARQLIQSAKKGAVIVLVGYSPSGEMTLPVGMALDKELTFKTVFRYRHLYPTVIDAIASGAAPVGQLVTNVFSLEEISQALAFCIHNKADVVKAVVMVDD
jgi:L-iditol 2-dehydrogenase